MQRIDIQSTSVCGVLKTIIGFDLVEAWYSYGTVHCLKEDKLSSTTVEFIRSEGNL